jgi:hypothetical protein
MTEKAQRLRGRRLDGRQTLDEGLRISENFCLEFALQRLDDGAQAQRHAASPPVLLPDVAGIQGLDHLVGNVMLGVDIDRFLDNQVILFGLGQ